MEQYDTFVNSTLETKAVADLQAQIDKELALKNPDKSIAQLLQENNEEKTISENQEEKNKDS
ncbi:hypothetical protein EBS40_02125 [bacterium]|nr:hypothetical protein [bacterium]